MKRQSTFNQLITEAVELSDDPNNLSVDSLCDAQLEKLTAAAIKEAGVCSGEHIYESPLFNDLIAHVIACLSEDDMERRKEMTQDLGEALLQCAIEGTKTTINQGIEEGIDRLQWDRFWNEETPASRNRFEHAIYNQPEL